MPIEPVLGPLVVGTSKRPRPIGAAVRGSTKNLSWLLASYGHDLEAIDLINGDYCRLLLYCFFYGRYGRVHWLVHTGDGQVKVWKKDFCKGSRRQYYAMKEGDTGKHDGIPSKLSLWKGSWWRGASTWWAEQHNPFLSAQEPGTFHGSSNTYHLDGTKLKCTIQCWL